MANVITIDGPTSSGKNSVGFTFADNIGYKFVDTGAIYRAGSILILRNGVSVNDETVVAQVFENLNIQFVTNDGKPEVFVNVENVTDILHNPEVTVIVPVVAAYKKVRDLAKQIQRNLGQENAVMVGRDIGSEIFPESKLKFFLTASAEIRAKRRFEQLKEIQPSITYDFVLKQMLYRDEQDSNRSVSPLRVPQDAISIDTSDKTIDETVEEMMENFKRVFGG